jgi:hypothetical protein
MKSLGYSYKKPQKPPSVNAPSKEDKIKTIKKFIFLIKKDLDNKYANIYYSDESHFTNELYFPRGYFKKGLKVRTPGPKKRETKSLFGSLNLQAAEEIPRCLLSTFINFGTTQKVSTLL